MARALLLLLLLIAPIAPSAGQDTERRQNEFSKFFPSLASLFSNWQLAPVVPTGQSHSASEYKPLLPVDVWRRVADATSSAWGAPAIGPTPEGVCIWRRKVVGSIWDEVRGTGVLDVRPQAVVRLFETSDVELIRSFNPLYDTGHDIEWYSRSAKAAYARVRSALPGFWPRDTVTVVEQV